MRIAVSEREASNAFRIESGEYLGDAAAAVISDDIHLIDVQRIEKVVEHLCICCDRHILVGCDVGVSVREQVDRYRAANTRQSRLLVTPEKAVHQYAAPKKSNR